MTLSVACSGFASACSDCVAIVPRNTRLHFASFAAFRLVSQGSKRGDARCWGVCSHRASQCRARQLVSESVSPPTDGIERMGSSDAELLPSNTISPKRVDKSRSGKAFSPLQSGKTRVAARLTSARKPLTSARKPLTHCEQSKEEDTSSFFSLSAMLCCTALLHCLALRLLSNDKNIVK